MPLRASATEDFTEGPSGPASTGDATAGTGASVREDDRRRRGEVRDYAELARLGHVTRARLSQIKDLLLSAPDI